MADARYNTAIRFPPELHERLRVAAEERHLSMNTLVVKALEDFLPRLIPAAELRLTRPSPTAAHGPAGLSARRRFACLCGEDFYYTSDLESHVAEVRASAARPSVSGTEGDAS